MSEEKKRPLKLTDIPYRGPDANDIAMYKEDLAATAAPYHFSKNTLQNKLSNLSLRKEELEKKVKVIQADLEKQKQELIKKTGQLKKKENELNDLKKNGTFIQAGVATAAPFDPTAAEREENRSELLILDEVILDDQAKNSGETFQKTLDDE